MTIQWDRNRLSALGQISTADIRWMSKALYSLVEERGYQDIYLDFANCTATFESFMLPSIALILMYARRNVSFALRVPSDPRLAALFHNAGWAHLIDPQNHPASTFSGTAHLPATRFDDAKSQSDIVDKTIDVVMSSVEGISRKSLQALEWAVSEITDNVLSHAKSAVGGFVQASTFPESRSVEFVVADAGLTIPTTLHIEDHERALEQSIKEGVTRDKTTNAGNGLFGTYRIAALSGGKFQLHSGKASLVASGDERLRLVADKKKYPGTAVVARIDCSKEGLLEEALRVDGRGHELAYDYIEKRFESEHNTEATVRMKIESSSFTSREAARALRTKIENLMAARHPEPLIIDFSDVFIVSSSFADEVFGKLFLKLGPIAFNSVLQLKNIDKTIRNLIDRAIVQRLSIGKDASFADEEM